MVKSRLGFLAIARACRINTRAAARAVTIRAGRFPQRQPNHKYIAEHRRICSSGHANMEMRWRHSACPPPLPATLSASRGGPPPAGTHDLTANTISGARYVRCPHEGVQWFWDRCNLVAGSAVCYVLAPSCSARGASRRRSVASAGSIVLGGGRAARHRQNTKHHRINAKRLRVKPVFLVFGGVLALLFGGLSFPFPL